jgi:uncharacterized membrane protein YeaQ/YmgE (transglycosylase-associated protein family)
LGYGIYFFMTFGAGSVGGSIGGWVSTHVGLQYTFPALAILLVPSVLAIILLVVRTRSRGSLDRAGEVPETTL